MGVSLVPWSEARKHRLFLQELLFGYPEVNSYGTQLTKDMKRNSIIPTSQYWTIYPVICFADDTSALAQSDGYLLTMVQMMADTFKKSSSH